MAPEAPPGTFKYHVYFDGNNCGGGIIGERHILTAGHCFIAKDQQFIRTPGKVIAGTNDWQQITSDAVTRKVIKVFVPRSYGGPSEDRSSAISDIAVVEVIQFITAIVYHLSLVMYP